MLLVVYHCAAVLLQNCVYHTRILIKVAFFGDLFGVQRSGDVMQETSQVWFPSKCEANSLSYFACLSKVDSKANTGYTT